MDNRLIDDMQAKVSKGEKSRILWELFMENMGLSFDTPLGVVVEEMKKTQTEYEEGVNFFGELMRQAHNVKNNYKNEEE